MKEGIHLQFTNGKLYRSTTYVNNMIKLKKSSESNKSAFTGAQLTPEQIDNMIKLKKSGVADATAYKDSQYHK